MRNATPFAAGRRLDVICLGRFAVDFYAQQIGARLEDVTSFAKYLGGSSANTAFGCARLGLKAALISRVGDDALGRFLVETIAREGCDVSRVGTDPSRLTGAVVLGIEDKDTFPLIFLRENCADMAIAESDVDEAFIAQSRALLITGTHFSTAHVDRISKLALDRARKNDVRTILDIDYRPVLWGLTVRGDGATRYVRSDTVTAHLQAILPKIDLVVGTIEEFNIAGGSTDIIESLDAVRRVTPAVLLVKRGPLGCAVIDGPIPRSLDDAFNGRGVDVEVLNVLGAGDAFSAGFLSGWVRGEDYDACCRYANACGALVVSRHGCAPAMPTRVELDYFLANAAHIPRPDQDAMLTRLHRVTAPRPLRETVFAFAFDHRNQFFELAQEMGADETRLPLLKNLFVDAVGETEASLGLAGSIGMLCDDRYGQDALNAATGRGWWIGRPVELPGSNPLVFDRGRSVGTNLIAWPQEHVVKCLVRFHPDDDRRQTPRAGSADSRALRRGAGQWARAPARDHSAGRAAASRRYCLPRDQAPVQPGNLSGVVEARADARRPVDGARRADRRARSVLPRRAAARASRGRRRDRPRISPRRGRAGPAAASPSAARSSTSRAASGWPARSTTPRWCARCARISRR